MGERRCLRRFAGGVEVEVEPAEKEGVEGVEEVEAAGGGFKRFGSTST